MRQVSPLRSIWLQPSRTIARVAHENPWHMLFVLPVVAGFVMLPTQAMLSGDVVEWGLGMATLLSFGPVVEVLQVFVGAWLLRITGIWLGGKSGIPGLRATIVWANAPIVLLAALSLIVLIVSSGVAAVRDEPLVYGESVGVTLAAWALFLAQVLVIGWSFVIFVRGLATVQGYSVPRAVLNSVLAWTIPAAVLALALVAANRGDMLVPLFFAGFETLLPTHGSA